MGGVKLDKLKLEKLKRSLLKLLHIGNWKLAFITILLGFWCATLIRFDHIQMTKLKDAVLIADEENNKESIAENLKKLRDFTNKHIIFNTVDDNGAKRIVFGTGPFYLKNQYQIAAQEAIAKAREEINVNTQNPNGNIFAEVSAYCDAWGAATGFDYPNQEYLDCWVNKLAEYPASETIGTSAAARVPSADLFRYDYASPIWCFCPSGIILAIVIIFSIIVLVRLIIWIVLRIAIRFVK